MCPEHWPKDLQVLGERLAELWSAVGLSEAEQAAAWASFEAEPAPGWRINPLLADVEAVLARLQADFPTLQLIPSAVGTPAVSGWIDLADRDALVRHPLVVSGAMYIQNLSRRCLSWTRNRAKKILDLAAAPGSKTTQIAALMNNTGYLAAVEPVRSRFFRLKANLERAKVTHFRLFMADGHSIGAKVPERFNRILLDAPCSSEARIVLPDEESWKHWRSRKLNEAAYKQRALIESAWMTLRPGGRLALQYLQFCSGRKRGRCVASSQTGSRGTRLVDRPAATGRSLGFDALAG